MELEQRREFLHNYDKLVELFGQELVDQGLMRYTDSQLLGTQDYPLKDANGRSLKPSKPYGPHIYVGRVCTHHRFTNREGWEKSVFVPVERYKVRNQYQHNYQSQLIVKPAMLALYPWLADFKLNIYSVHFYENGSNEFYVKLSREYSGHTCLYVPYKAFMDGDVEAIIKRNEEYLKWYTKSDEVWNAMREDPVIDEFLSKAKGNNK
jgi:hypothetical protein